MQIDAEYILEQHAFASDQYADAIALSEEVEGLFKNNYGIPNDGDSTHANAPSINKPAKARAILDKFLTLLSVRAAHKLSVIPKDNGPEEQAACSKIERWLSGYQRAYQMETKRNPWRDAAWWYLFRGRGCLETRVDTSLVNTERQFIRTLAPDPNTVFPVWGENGIGYYTKSYSRYAWDIAKETDRRKGGKKKNKWQSVELPDDENEQVTIVEFWDDEYCGAVVGEKLLYTNQHKYGCVPLSEGHCMDTPLADMEWSYQSVLAPIMDTIKQQYALASKMAAGVDLFYWPVILCVMDDGRVLAYDGGTVSAAQIPAGVKSVQVITPTPNQSVLAQLMAWYKSDEQLGGIPDIAWGAEPTSLQSGFAIGQVLGQVKDKIADKKEALEMMYGWDWSHKLILLDKLGDASGVYSKVPVEKEFVYGAA